MFGFIKRKGRTQSAIVHSAISDFLRDKIEKLSRKTRYVARVRLLNRWGRKYPKKVALYYSLFVVVILSVNIIGFVIPRNQNQNPDPMNLTQIVDSDPLNGMQTINLNRELIRETVQEYADANLKLANKLDSLCNLKVKTQQDSIEIANIWKLINNPTFKTYESTTD